MNEIITVAIVVCIIIALVSAGYFIGWVCSRWDRYRELKRYRKQRKG